MLCRFESYKGYHLGEDMSDPNDKKPLRKKGEFSEKRKIRQRQASIYNTLNEACTKVMAKDPDGFFRSSETIEVIVDNRKFTISNNPNYKGYMFTAFLRLKKRGIVLAECCDQDSGWIDVILPYAAYITQARSLIADSVAAYVTKIEILEDIKPNSPTSKRLKLLMY